MMRKQIVGENIRRLRDSKRMSQGELAESIGRRQPTVAMYENGKRLPSPEIMSAIAELFGVSYDDVYYSREELRERTIDIGRTVAAIAQRRNPTQLATTDSLVDKLINAGELSDAGNADGMRRIPIIGDTAAGAPIYANQTWDDFIEIPTYGRQFDAAVRVTGDSMEPQFSVGDLALLRYQDDVEDGQIAVVFLDDEVTLKRVFHSNGALQLQSDNHKYATMIVTCNDYCEVRILGLVVGAIRFGIH